MREIKFRGKRKNGTEWLIGDLVRTCNGGPCIFPSDDTLGLNSPDFYEVDEKTIGQFSGKKGFNDRELFEGDIVFYEEAGEDGDTRYYLVIIWIAEWSMFASLFMDEYLKYVEFGDESLDETMFWTFTLEQSSIYHYAGNIYENPELLK